MLLTGGSLVHHVEVKVSSSGFQLRVGREKFKQPASLCHGAIRPLPLLHASGKGQSTLATKRIHANTSLSKKWPTKLSFQLLCSTALLARHRARAESTYLQNPNRVQFGLPQIIHRACARKMGRENSKYAQGIVVPPVEHSTIDKLAE